MVHTPPAPLPEAPQIRHLSFNFDSMISEVERSMRVIKAMLRELQDDILLRSIHDS